MSPLGFSAVNEDHVDYKILRKIQQEEKSSPLLTKINDHLFENASSYHAMLLIRLKKEEKSSRNLMISEQIQNVEKIFRSIYEIREKKIILAAMAKARGGSPYERYFLPAEKTLFTTIYSLLIRNREILLNNKEHPKPKPSEKKIQDERGEPRKESPESKASEDDADRTVIRVLETIPTFIGTDSKNYHLRKYDIVSIPSPLASMLISKQVAEQVMIHP